MPVLPPLRKSLLISEGARVLDIADGAESLRVKKLPWAKGPRILMLASPSCAPSGRVIADIERDAGLSASFSTHVFLIAGPHEISSLLDIAVWNETHKPLRLHVAYSSRDWPMFHRLSTPTLIFLKDGTQVRRIEGWSGTPAELHAALLGAMESIGLRPE